MAEKIVLGFSGGVDSSVAAALLSKAGYDVHGLYLDNAATAERAAAENAARAMGIPLAVIDISAALEENVCAPFAAEYLAGRTPNPCILCNPSVKFPALLKYADEIGAEKIATGHYAKAENGRLYRADSKNDQSYMLCRLTESILRRTVFPLGEFEKTAVRGMAQKLALPTAEKPDSMEICFIPDNDYAAWLNRRAAAAPEGDLIFEGEAIARHAGIHRYTVGMKIPGLYGGERLYVERIDAENNAVCLNRDTALWKSEITAEGFNWINGVPEGEIEGTVRVRHTKADAPCTASAAPDGSVKIKTRTPVRAPAPGQSAVLYRGDLVLGGGYIA